MHPNQGSVRCPLLPQAPLTEIDDERRSDDSEIGSTGSDLSLELHSFPVRIAGLSDGASTNGTKL